mgnify:CR=1 FL=1
MSILILGLVILLAGHSVQMAPAFHARVQGKLGRPVYRGLYSVVAVIGVALVIEGFGRYRAEGMIPVWDPPTGMKHLNLLLMLFAFIALVASLVPRGFIKARLKHPMLVGLKAWAFGHLLANGDLGSIILFGSILAWAVIDRISFRWRPQAAEPPAPRILGDILAVGIGVIAYGLMLYLHPILIGVSVFG